MASDIETDRLVRFRRRLGADCFKRYVDVAKVAGV